MERKARIRARQEREATTEHVYCKRVGFVRSGGHCAVCGFDVAPGEGIRVDPTHIACHDPKCRRLASTINGTLEENRIAFHRSEEWKCGGTRGVMIPLRAKRTKRISEDTTPEPERIIETYLATSE